MIEPVWIGKIHPTIKEFMEKYQTSYDGIDTTSWQLFSCIGDNNDVAIFTETNELYDSFHLIWWDVKIQNYLYGCISSQNIVGLIDKISLWKLLLAKIKSLFNKQDTLARFVSIHKALGI